MKLVQSDGQMPQKRYPVSRRGIARPVKSVGVRQMRGEFELAEADTAADLRRYAHVLLNRWKTLVSVFAITVLGVAIGTYMQSPVYRATGMLEIRQQAADVASVEGLYESQRISEQYLQTQYEILRSSALARRIIADTFSGDAEGTARSPAEMDRAVTLFRKQLTIDPVTGSGLVKVSFKAESPDLAARVVNSVFKHYVAMRVEAGRTAERWLSEQVDSVRTELAKAEQQLQQYVQANGLVFVDDQAGGTENMAHERLRHLQQQLTDAEAQRYAKESNYGVIQTQGDGYLDSGVLQALGVRAADLRGEYAKLSSTFTESYPRTQQIKSQLTAVENLLARERQRVASETRNDYFASRQRESLLRQAFEKQKQAIDGLSAKAAEYRVLRRDVDGHQQLYATLQQKQKAAGVSAALATTEVGIVDLAVPPQEPVSPVPHRNLQLAMLVGMVLGLGLAFVREYADPAISTVEHVDAVSTVPVLGMIPSARAIDAKILADAFASLRTSILFDLSGLSARSLLVTSAQPGDGKTTISTNLSISLAQLGKRVLLIDADIRRPSVHRTFGLARQAGLANYLDGSAERPAITAPNVIAGLDVIPAGHSGSSPAELLSSSRMAELLKDAEETYDFVILDSPAVLINASDARVLASLADSVVLVVRSGTTPRESLTRMLKQIRNVAGVIVNDLDTRQFRGYYADYAALEQPRAYESA